MKTSDYIIKSFIHAAGVFIYVSGVAWVLMNGKDLFGEASSFLVPLLILLLFVISASITGLLVLGKPILMYLNGKKKEAFVFLFATLGWLALFVVKVMIVLAWMR